MKVLGLAVFAMFLIGLSACDSPSDELNSQQSEAPAGENTLEFSGEIRHTSLEGGAWIIQATDSTRYEPLNLNEKYHEEGLNVRVVAEEKPDRMSFLQIGPIIEIKSIEKR
jgi:hypothetical protein